MQVEPYIVGKYIKYSSNAGYINSATLDDICHVRVLVLVMQYIVLSCLVKT
jgi:hypothetical protein